MTTPHEAVAAWPVSGNASKPAARALATRRLPYALAASESASDLVVVDPATGVVPLYIVQNGTLYEYDSLDSTTIASAVCLVTSDGKRYKSGGITPPYSVLTLSVTAQPATPSIGDRYLIPTAATGADWAGKDGKIGIYTAAGWQFAISPVGRLLHIEDTTTFYHRDASGAWFAGFGSVVIEADGVNITNMLGAQASFVVKVENQTTNSPPASPVAPVAYIVGPTPTGGWSAYSPGDLAFCLVDGTFTRIVPTAGDEVYDKSTLLPYTWSGSAWQTAAGELVVTYRYYTASATWSKPARLSYIEVEVVGGGGNSMVGGGGTATSGSTSSFGSHCSATGGAGGKGTGVSPGGTGGSGSGGDINLSGETGQDKAITTDIVPIIGGRSPGSLNTKGVGAGTIATAAYAAGGGGGASFKRILAASLGSSETVTVGSAAQNNGYVWVKEYTRA